MNIGLTLMAVGMVTVFTVLLIIINLSKVLIKVVNKVAPEEEVKTKGKAAPKPAAIPQDIMAVIKETVAQVTGGKGSVANVTKI